MGKCTSRHLFLYHQLKIIWEKKIQRKFFLRFKGAPGQAGVPGEKGNQGSKVRTKLKHNLNRTALTDYGALGREI